MSWVLVYIATNFLAPIPLISPRIDDFFSQFPPKSMNSSRRISRKSPSRQKPSSDWLKPAHRLKPALFLVGQRRFALLDPPPRPQLTSTRPPAPHTQPPCSLPRTAPAPLPSCFSLATSLCPPRTTPATTGRPALCPAFAPPARLNPPRPSTARHRPARHRLQRGAHG
jgi:hypothetical protein